MSSSGNHAAPVFGGAQPFGACPVSCTGIPEGEACGAVVNNGCNFGQFHASNFVAANCGETYCGTVWATGGNRDTDFFLLQLDQVTTLTAELVTNAPVVMALVQITGASCAQLDVFDVAYQNGNCAPITASGTIPGGSYYIFIAPDPGNGAGLFDGVLCGSGNDYALTITCTSPPCQLSSTGTSEGENVPSSTNSGCDASPEVYQSIGDGDSILGTVWASGGNRDSDWYQFTVSGAAQAVTATLTSEFPGMLRLAPSNCQDPQIGLTTSAACATGTLSTVVSPGVYSLSVVPGDIDLGESTGGIPVTDPANQYLVTLDLDVAPPTCSISCTGNSEPDPCGATTDDGCTSGTFLDLALDGSPSCGEVFADGGVRDVDWYQFGVAVPTAVTISIESEFPSQVLLGKCSVLPGFVTILQQDNGSGCLADPAMLTMTLEPGAYFVTVTIGTGPLGIGNVLNGFPCSGGNNSYRISMSATPPAPTCQVLSAGAPEIESCGETNNNGCNMLTPTFETVVLGETRRGTSWADASSRDTDWWTFTLTEPTQVSWVITGELPLNSFIVAASPAGCDASLIISQFVVSAGACVPTPSGTIDLPCGSYSLFVGPGDVNGGSIHHGFPCGSGRNDYEFTLTGVPSVVCDPPTLDLTADCVSGRIEMEIDVLHCLASGQIVVTDPGGSVIETVALTTPLGPCVVQSALLGPYTETGTYSVTLTGSCCSGGSFSTSQELFLAVYDEQTEVVWRPASSNPSLPVGYSGNLPSAVQLNNILMAPPLDRKTYLIDDLLTFNCLGQLGPRHTIWVMLGSFPDNHALRDEEAQILVNLLSAGVSVYIEGSDVWGFDPPTLFSDYDGVQGRSEPGPVNFVSDGDDSFTSMDGAAHADMDLTTLTSVGYFQDNTSPVVFNGTDSTDRLQPTRSGPSLVPDIPGTNAGVIWRNHADGNPAPAVTETAYATGIYYLPDDLCRGRVIAQSWELGGFGGDLQDLAATYLTHLKTQQPGSGFRRGNCNDDTAVNIADVIFLLGYIFSFGPATPPNCDDACDANDDGGLNIADTVSLLASLFGNPTLPLVEPTCICGPDPTPDSLDCDSYNTLDCN